MKINNYKKLALTGISTAILTACSSGGSCGSCAVPVPIEGSKLIFVSPSILPSLANVRGVNYMGLYNPTNTAISNISYSLGQIVGSGSSVTLDQNSAKACANIAAKSSCFLKLSVPESTIAGGAVVTASNSDGTEAATPLAIGVQQVPYVESANANGVGLYFYPKAQYSESGVPFMLATAVVQSPNVGNINTIELVDESGNLITGQYVTSGNSGAGAAQLTMGSVVQIVVPLPQGVNLSKNYKVRTSYQSTPSVLSTIAEKLGLANKQAQATSNETIGTQVYTLTTQGNNINLQFTPNQIYLTGTNPVQYGYLYNIGDLTASQIKVSSSSSNVRITAANTILDGQRVIKVTYELINSTVAPATNLVTVTAQNPAGQTQTSTGGTNQNVNPLPVPTPTPMPTPTPTPPPLPQLLVTKSQNPVGGGACSTITATVPSPASSPTTVTFITTPSLTSSYGFGSSSSGPFTDTTTCIISADSTSCATSDSDRLCAASSAGDSSFAINGSANSYASGTANITVTAPPLSASVDCGYPLPGIDTASSCTAVTASIPTALSSNLTVTFSIPTASTGLSNYYFSSAYGGSTSSTTDCTITAASTSCISTLLLCAGASTNDTSVPVTVSATGYAESITSASGSNAKYIFTTNATYTGDLKTAGNGTDGYDGANKLCQAAANSGSITGSLSATWKAILNTNNATKNCQYYKNTNQNPTVGNSNILGSANNSGNFVGALQIPNASNGAKMNWDENGSQFPAGNMYVWTGQGPHCNNWTNGSDLLNGQTGNPDENSSSWWLNITILCDSPARMHLYCAQQ